MTRALGARFTLSYLLCNWHTKPLKKSLAAPTRLGEGPVREEQGDLPVIAAIKPPRDRVRVQGVNVQAGDAPAERPAGRERATGSSDGAERVVPLQPVRLAIASLERTSISGALGS